MERQVKVLVVDDSAFMRKVLSDLLQSDPELTVVATARDGVDGVTKALALRPDVVTLDIEMPRLDGFGALQEIMRQQPMPIVMVSSLTQTGAEATIRALAMGAVDFAAKPSGSISVDMYLTRDVLIAKVKAAAGATPRYRRIHPVTPPVAAALQPISGTPCRQLVVIGCSTGGPGALHQILPFMPANLDAGVLIVQHMPAGFTRSLAQRLDEISPLHVKEAEEGDQVQNGWALVAPGGSHLMLDPRGRVQLDQGATMHGVRPAVDKTFESTVPVWGHRMVGVILTGMGYDGAKGMVALKRQGGRTIAEDASTCVIYGMPKVVADLGAADYVLPIQEIASAIVRLVQTG